MLATRVPTRNNIRGFGRRQPFVRAEAIAAPPSSLRGDLRLFLVNFLGGLVFMTIYLA